jgi:hypothetical protein
MASSAINIITGRVFRKGQPSQKNSPANHRAFFCCKTRGIHADPALIYDSPHLNRRGIFQRAGQSGESGDGAPAQALRLSQAILRRSRRQGYFFNASGTLDFSKPLPLYPTGAISRRHLAHFVSAVDSAPYQNFIRPTWRRKPAIPMLIASKSARRAEFWQWRNQSRSTILSLRSENMISPSLIWRLRRVIRATTML